MHAKMHTLATFKEKETNNKRRQKWAKVHTDTQTGVSLTFQQLENKIHTCPPPQVRTLPYRSGPR